MPSRLVGAKLNLKLGLSDGNPDRYVRAFLYDITGAPLVPPHVDMIHQVNGLYSDDTALMPNSDQVSAIYRIYSDAGYSIQDMNYSQALDVFEKELFDPTSLVVKPYAIFAKVIRPRISVSMIPNPLVTARIRQNNEINPIVTGGQIKIIIKQEPILEVIS